MDRKDLNQVNVLLALISVIRTADADGATCDLLGYDGCRIQVDVGNSGDTLSGSLDINLEVEHSDDDSTWTDCADTDLTDSVTGANTGTFQHIDAPTEDSAIFTTEYIGGKRYVRVVWNITGTHTNGCAGAASYHRFRPKIVV